ERLEYLTKTFEGFVENDALPGSVILVARKGEIAYYKAFGKRDIEQNDPMERTDIFRIASQTKAIVSVGIMILQERGLLTISEPVGKYIPEFNKTTVAVPDEYGGYTIEQAHRAITIRDLLTHTAGVGYGNGVAADTWNEAWIQGWYYGGREDPIVKAEKRMAKLPCDAQPGEKVVYGNSTDMLGALIEAVSAQRLDAFLSENVFQPLGMNDTHFYL